MSTFRMAWMYQVLIIIQSYQRYESILESTKVRAKIMKNQFYEFLLDKNNFLQKNVRMLQINNLGKLQNRIYGAFYYPTILCM